LHRNFELGAPNRVVAVAALTKSISPMSNQVYQRRSPISHRLELAPKRDMNREMTKPAIQLLHKLSYKKVDTNEIDGDDEWESDDDIPSQDTGSGCHVKYWFRAYSALVVSLTIVLLWMFHNYIGNTEPSIHEKLLPQGYTSVEEMLARPLRFPSVEDRIKLYMSSWYSPPCNPTDGKLHTSDETNVTYSTNATLPQYNFLQATPEEAPLLLLQELQLPHTRHELFGRLFLIDSGAEPQGSLVFYLDPMRIRQCNHSFCLDTLTYLLPALKRIQEATGKYWQVPVLMEFGDAEVSRAYRPVTHKNESYPNVPLIKKFRYAMSQSEVRRITSRTCYSVTGNGDHDIPITRKGEARIQPSK
jgi:hypothetical protein